MRVVNPWPSCPERGGCSIPGHIPGQVGQDGVQWDMCWVFLIKKNLCRSLPSQPSLGFYFPKYSQRYSSIYLDILSVFWSSWDEDGADHSSWGVDKSLLSLLWNPHTC